MKILIVLPVYNEETILASNVLAVFDFCQKKIIEDWQLVIVNNKSTDRTAEIGQNLAKKFERVNYLYLDKKGKGAAIKAGWQSDQANIYCFIDADLATDLAALPRLIEGIKAGYDIVIGSRFHPQSRVNRSLIRRFTAWGYRLVLKLFLGIKINDAPCGFKAINEKVKEKVLPQVKNEVWFFDSELVIIAEKQGYKIKEIPIKWSERRKKSNKSRVKILPLILAYLKEVISLKKRLKNF